ncbi:hypothetical protein B9Q11_02885 [Candidatus Marsarchaeota G2 archaeon ECH_B_SAG-F08]|jgi:acetoin utilization protein AcuC|nr:MAG: hypothetical protein B9Q11_02885 [Candidatus Marsarchaeota G2 archaeon ECH_B_SAG-F08]
MSCAVRFIKVAKELSYGFPPPHPFRKDRLNLTLKTLDSVGALSKLDLIEVTQSASEEDILSFHSNEYLEFVKRMSKIGSGYLDQGDTPAFLGCYEVAATAVACTLKAIEEPKEDVHVINFNGGLHHAMPRRASGFCIFNDIAIAIKKLLERGFQKIAYVDIDAHHGDGVMYGFYGDKRVLDIDFHEDGRYLFPGTGFYYELGEGEAKGYKANIVLPPGASDKEYLYAYERVTKPLLEQFKPEILILQAGVDAHEGDPLTHLKLTDQGYLQLYKRIHNISHELRCPLVVLGGGGYDPNNVSRCWSALTLTLLGENEFYKESKIEKIKIEDVELLTERLKEAGWKI